MITRKPSKSVVSDIVDGGTRANVIFVSIPGRNSTRNDQNWNNLFGLGPATKIYWV